MPRMRVAIANTHNPTKNRPMVERRREARLCRVIVVPDPIGNNHQVHRVPDGVERETVMQRVLETIMRAA